MQARGAEGLNIERRRQVRDTVKGEFTEFSCRPQAGDQGVTGVTTISHEVSCMERSQASELGRVEFES